MLVALISFALAFSTGYLTHKWLSEIKLWKVIPIILIIYFSATIWGYYSRKGKKGLVTLISAALVLPAVYLTYKWVSGIEVGKAILIGLIIYFGGMILGYCSRKKNEKTKKKEKKKEKKKAEK